MLLATGCVNPVFDGFLVKDIQAKKASSYPSALVQANGTVYFTANDDVHGNQLWKSDGTTAGTQFVKIINPDGGGFGFGAASVAFNSELYFRAYDGTDVGLWKTDGTDAGTVAVKTFPAADGDDLEQLTVSNGKLFFATGDITNGHELWVSDGTGLGTQLLKNIRPGTASSFPNRLTDVSGTLYFVADNGTDGMQLWKSDGTGPGTTMVTVIHAGGAQIDALHALGVNLVFAANDGANGQELWKSDGTGPGTTMVKDINPSGSSQIGEMVQLGSSLYFVADDGTHGPELWKTDGTTGNTLPVGAEINSTGNPDIHDLTVVNATPSAILYFVADDGTHGPEVWQSDGTSTHLSADVNTTGGSDPQELTADNDTLIFTADDGSHGREVWQTTDSTGGARMVVDLNPKKLTGSNPQGLTQIDGSVLFSADNGKLGQELWSTNAPPAVITKIKPTKGCPGTTVTVTGKYLQNLGLVRFHGTTATSHSLSSADGTTFTAVVPNATTGPIEADSPNGQAFSPSPFTIPAPVVKSLKPSSGQVGTTVTIKGSCFTGVSSVTFNGTPASFVDIDSDKQITAGVDAGTTSGPVEVTAAAGTGTSKKPFTVTP